MIAADEALAAATARLRAAGVEAPARESRLLLAHAQGRALPDLAAPIPCGFEAMLARRAAREPMALIIGRQGFWTLDLEVSPATLIPRADSETLIEAALDAFPDRRSVRRILDLGTGTGALLLAAMTEFTDSFGLGVDLVPEAAALAARNAARHGLEGRCAFLAADWAAALAGARFNLVLVNPPYIRRDDIARLMPEVSAHEPGRALDGGPDGLDAFRAVLPEFSWLLAPGGVAVLEVGLGQAEAVESLAAAAGLRVGETRADLAGIPRAVVVGAWATRTGVGTARRDD